MLLLTIIFLIFLTSFALSINLSLLNLLILLFSLYGIFLIILKFLFRLELAPVNDILQMYGDTEKTRCYIMTGIIFENQIDEQEFIGKIKERALMHPYYEKLTKSLQIYSKIFLLGVWKKTNNFNIDQHVIINRAVIRNYDHFCETMASQLSDLNLPGEIPQWRFYIYPNFEGGKSALIMKIHHAYIDGISGFAYFLNLTDSKNYNFINLPKVKKWMLPFAYLIGFFQMLYVFPKTLFSKHDEKPFHKGKLTGKKEIYSMEVCNLDEIKRFSKPNAVTINDTLVAVLNETIRQHSLDIYNHEIKDLYMMIPYSLRPMPTPEIHYPLKNNSAVFQLNIPIFSGKQILTVIKDTSKLFSKIKYSYENYVVPYALEALNLIFPPLVTKYIVKRIAQKVSVVCTNVPGPIDEIKCFGKHPVESIVATVNLFFDVELVFCIVSYNRKIALTCIADTSINFNAKIFVEKYRSFLRNDVLNLKLK